ncbi:30S ribosomal protein S7 [Patescibacteria group bacterium]|nr:30S ribosomal protein S7 [Patescibacteria group bacterium]MBU1684441.1 30S ribosomal protein S7 [Patescibacteria group bacterium]MBU1987328.1 30S ribosomal protein S7 [Patescibacteria group bacterium]
MRGKQAPKRKIQNDIKYNDDNIAKFINYIMKDGKKTVAQKIVYGAFDIIKQKTKQDPKHIFQKAIKKIAPLIEVRSKRIGGGNYQIPYQVRGDRRFALASRWLIEATKARKGEPMVKKLSDELLAAVEGEGAAVKKREIVRKMVEANRAFAHFAR